MKVLVVDDEHLARKKVRLFLDGEPDVDVVGESRDGNEAVDMIRELEPDLVFLDIQMPGLDGFDVIQTVGVGRMPPVVFVTAFDQYAVKAFEVRALDYLLKPVERERLHEAMQRAREWMQPSPKAGHEELRTLIEELKGRKQYNERLRIREEGRTILLPVDSIDWVESCRNYLCVHAGKESHIIRETMGRLENKLDPARFARIHRCTLVNLDRIREIQPYFSGDQIVILTDGKRLTLSRNYRYILDKLC